MVKVEKDWGEVRATNLKTLGESFHNAPNLTYLLCNVFVPFLSIELTHKDQHFTASSTQVLDLHPFTAPQALAVEGAEDEVHTPQLSEQPTEISTNPSDSAAREEERSQAEGVA